MRKSLEWTFMTLPVLSGMSCFHMFCHPELSVCQQNLSSILNTNWKLTVEAWCELWYVFVFHSFTSSLGVGYMMVCTENYPNVLAFSFLDELQREFIVTYDTKRINSALRPFSFIEFGEFLEGVEKGFWQASVFAEGEIIFYLGPKTCLHE